MTNKQIEDISGAIIQVSISLDHLGNGNAATSMGAIENLAKELQEGTIRVAAAIESVADAIRDRSA